MGEREDPFEGQADPYRAPGPDDQGQPYGPAGPYGHSGSFGQAGPYNQSGSFGQAGPYDRSGSFGQPGPYGAPGPWPVPYGSPPPNYLVWAILTTIFCCLPLGIVSIVFAAQVSSKWAAGDVHGAELSSRRAKQFAMGSAISVVIIAVLYTVPGLMGAYFG